MEPVYRERARKKEALKDLGNVACDFLRYAIRTLTSLEPKISNTFVQHYKSAAASGSERKAGSLSLEI